MSNDDFKLALVRYIYNKFGYETKPDDSPFNDISDIFKNNRQSTINSTRQTLWFSAAKKAFLSDNSMLKKEDIRTYDENIYEYLEEINIHRHTDIKLRYYQYVSLFFTEYILDNLENNDNFIDEYKEFIGSEFDSSLLKDIDLNSKSFDKIAYWMATGSGKTYILHINFLQIKKYKDKDSYNNAILISPTEQVAEQHMEELDKNGIKNSNLSEYKDNKDVELKVTDINKLKIDESGPKTIDVKELGKNNIIFVDEGHKGLGSLGNSSSGWVDIRNCLTEEGFSFEYSATFGSSLKNAKGYQEYGRSIIFDYPYGRFHEDEYGKDFNIMNITPSDEDKEYIRNEQNKWLLANLLSYYEKVLIHKQNNDVMNEYNIDKPLSIFVGNSVNAVKRGNKSDVQTIVSFLSSIIQNENGWVKDVLHEMINKDGKFSESGLFNDSFEYLRKEFISVDSLYNDILYRLFDSKNPSELEVIRLKNLDDEEIALSTDNTDSYFGVITIGDTRKFYNLISDSNNNIKTIENEIHNNSLFNKIDIPNSPIKFLIGAKKFTEGWNSERPSTMGLLNIGRSEGPMVVQMFGRGVRVSGKDENGKRTELKNLKSKNRNIIKRLETLDVFGVRAEYIEEFKNHLESERINIDELETVNVKVNKEKEIEKSNLKVPEFQDATDDDNMPIFSLNDSLSKQGFKKLNINDENVSIDISPEIKIQSKGSKITKKDGEYNETITEENVNHVNISNEFCLKNKSELNIDILDWDKIWSNCLKYKKDKEYTELIINKNAIKEIIKENKYYLEAPDSIVNINSFSRKELSKIESLCEHIISKYMDNVYSKMIDSATEEKIELTTIDEEWLDNRVPEEYNIDIIKSEENKELINRLNDLSKKDYNKLNQILFKTMKQLYHPVFVNSNIVKEKYNESIKSITPEGIGNEGEYKFIESLEYHIENGVLEDYETMIMRNQANSGVKIPELSGNTYPDFIIWATKDEIQHIILADPHGIMLDELDVGSLNRINNELIFDEKNVEVHYCIFARTLAGKKETEIEITKDKYNPIKEHIYLIDDADVDIKNTKLQVESMLENYLED